MAEIEFCIRPFTPQDQIAARTLILEGMREHFGMIDETLNPDLNDITGSYLLAGHLFLLAEYAGSIIGTGALLINPDATGQMVRISTTNRYRRQGIARALCTQLIAQARQHNLTGLIVETNSDWTQAIKLYQSMGFVEYLSTPEQVYLSFNLI